MSPSKPQKSVNPFLELTWMDIENWAGATILSRGKNYQRSGCVKGLGITTDNHLVAWVDGSTRYATRVSIAQGELSSVCTCPYGSDCKHGVAVVIEYLHSIKKKKEIPVIAETDKRLALIEKEISAWNENSDDWDEEFSDDYEEPQKSNPESREDLEAWIKGKSKAELRALLLEVAQNHPQIVSELQTGFSIAPPSAAGLAQRISKEIDRVSQEPAWSDHWSHAASIPDYSNIASGLQQLFDAGHFDDIIKLGKKLFTKGMEQIGQSNDEGETLDEVSRALDIVFKALLYCSLADVDKMEQAVEWEVEDDYDLCDGLELFWKSRFDTKAWSDLADRLLGWLNVYRPMQEEVEFHHHYRRNKLTDQIVSALGHASRKEEMLQLCIREAPLTASYERLVKVLRKSGNSPEAEEWIKKGIEATRHTLPGIAAALRTQYLEIRTSKKDWLFCAALEADLFFTEPCINTYTPLKIACERINLWDKTRPAIIHFLHNGQPPTGKEWPLPETGIEGKIRNRHGSFPDTDLLIEIALLEKDLDEALRLYDEERQNKKGFVPWRFSWRTGISEQIADAVQHKYPDRSIAIWKAIAESHIAQKNPKEYSVAMGYLNKIMKVMKLNTREAEFRSYLATLRAEHIRKYRLVEMLDSLTGKRIVDG
jgi:uncharacterized Zn finger protein